MPKYSAPNDPNRSIRSFLLPSDREAAFLLQRRRLHLFSISISHGYDFLRLKPCHLTNSWRKGTCEGTACQPPTRFLHQRLKEGRNGFATFAISTENDGLCAVASIQSWQMGHKKVNECNGIRSSFTTSDSRSTDHVMPWKDGWNEVPLCLCRPFQFQIGFQILTKTLIKAAIDERVSDAANLFDRFPFGKVFFCKYFLRTRQLIRSEWRLKKDFTLVKYAVYGQSWMFGTFSFLPRFRYEFLISLEKLSNAFGEQRFLRFALMNIWVN